MALLVEVTWSYDDSLRLHATLSYPTYSQYDVRLVLALALGRGEWRVVSG
jgi:hypothetical protein